MAVLGEPINVSAVTSWGNASTDCVGQLVNRNKFSGLVYNANGADWDATGLADTSLRVGQSIRSVGFTLDAHLLTPLDGYLASLTFASGDVANMNSWEMTIARRLGDVSVFGSQWASYAAGRYGWSGSFSGFADDTAAPSAPMLSAGAAAATFTIISGGTGKNLTGNIQLTGSQGSHKVGSDATRQYGYKGDNGLTTAGSSVAALWAADSGGTNLGVTAPKALVLTLASGMTLSGSALWENIKVSCKVGSPMTVSVSGKFTGTVTGLTA